MKTLLKNEVNSKNFEIIVHFLIRLHIFSSQRFLALLILCYQTVDGVILECEFKTTKTYYGSEYTCFAKNFQTSLHDRTVTEIKGNHLQGKTNNDVKQLMLEKQFIPYLPLKVGDFFKNLKIFFAKKSNVRHVLQGDLDGLDNLEVFDLTHNPVEQLGANFFKGHSKISTVAFYDCHLKMIDPAVLDPLKKINNIFFNLNYCIDFVSNGDDAVNAFKIEIADKCQGHVNDKIFKHHEKKPVCSKLHDESKSHKSAMSFVQKHCYVFLVVLTISNIVLSIFLLQNSKEKIAECWSELNLI